jgi:endo-1,4-beta-mannosidase
MERIAARGLRAMPTFYIGHMSGINWLPAWTLDRTRPPFRFETVCGGIEVPYGIGDMYTGELLEAQRLFARTVGERFRGDAAILAWDLGNEFSNLCLPRTAADSARWSDVLTHDLLDASGIGVTGGAQGDDIADDRTLRLSSMARPWAFATMHGYPVYSSFARDRSDPDVVPFLSALTASFTGKPVLFSEFGNPTLPADAQTSPWPFEALTEHEMARYATAVLERLHARGALGALWWCWADYRNDAPGRAPFIRMPHETSFGIIRQDGSEKPIAHALAAFARQRRAVLDIAPYAGPDETAYYDGMPASVAGAYAEYLARYADA